MSTVDNRVVSIVFDNSEFEREIEATIRQLERLNAELNVDSAGRAFSQITEAAAEVNLTPMEDGVDRVKASFSAMGVIGMTILSELTKTVMEYSTKFTKALVDPIMEGGKKRAINIEQAKFQFKGLGMDIEATMANVSKAVSGTAYSLDAAAKVAAQLGASGYRAGEEMQTILSGISGVAAMTGSSYEDIGNVFTKVAGQGRVMGDDLNRLASRGMNASAVLAKAFNTTEAEIRSMVSKGQISFMDFAQTLHDEFAEHATSANETFTGSLSNVNAALARIGEGFWAPAIIHLRNLFNALIPAINGVKASMEPVYILFDKFMGLATGFAIATLGAIDFTKVAAEVTSVCENGVTATGTFSKYIGLLGTIAGMAGDALKGLGRFAGDVATFFAPLITSGYHAFGTLAEYLERVLKAIRESKVAGTVLRVFGDVLYPVAELFRDLTIRMFDAISGMDTFGDRASDMGVKVTKILSPFEKLGNSLGRMFKELAGIGVYLFNDLFAVLTKISDVLGDIFDKANNNRSEDGEALLGLGKASVWMVALRALYGIVELIANVSLTGWRNGFVGNFLFGSRSNPMAVVADVRSVMWEMQLGLKALQNTIKAEGIRKIAEALLILAGAMFVLSIIDQENLGGVLVSMLAIMAMMKIFVEGMANISDLVKTKEMNSLSLMIFTTAIAMTFMATALKKMSAIPFANMVSGLIGMAASMGVLLGALVIAAKVAVIVRKYSIDMVQIAASMFILALALKEMAKTIGIIGALPLEQAILGVIGLLGMLGALTMFLKKADFSKMSIQASISLMLLGKAIKYLCEIADIDIESLSIAAGALAGVMTIIVGSLYLLSNIKGGVEKNMLALKSVGTTIMFLALALKILSGIDMVSMAVGVAGLAGAVTIVTIAGMKATAAAAGLAALSTAMLACGGAMLMAGVGMTLFGTGIAQLALVVAASGFVIFQSLETLMNLIPVFAYNVGLGIGNFIKGLGESAVLMAEAFINLIEAGIVVLVKTAPTLANGIVQFIIELMRSAISSVTLLSGVFADLLCAVFEAAAEHAPRIIISFVKMLSHIFVTCMEAFNELDMQVLVGALLSLGIIVALMYALSGLGAICVPALVGVLALVAVIAALSVAFAAIGLMLKIPGFTQMINNGGAVLVAIGTAIGGFIGSLVGTAALAASRALPEIGENLTGFSKKASHFLKTLEKLNPSILLSAVALAGTITALTAASIINGVLKFVTGGASFVKFGEDIAEFGKSFGEFYKHTKMIKPDVVNGAANAAKSIAELEKCLPKTGGLQGISDALTGSNSVSKWGQRLPEFGKCMFAFYKEIKGINAKLVTEAATAGGALAALEKKLPSTGGVWQLFAGEKDLAGWGEQLVSFGEAMKAFDKSIAGINTAVITNAAIAGEALIEMSSKLPKTDTFFEWFTGKTGKLSDFGNELVAFGKAMRRFSEEINGIDNNVVRNSASAGSALIEMSGKLPKTDTFFEWFYGKTGKLSDFGAELIEFGKAMRLYSFEIQGIDNNVIRNSATAGSALIDMANKLPTTNLLFDWINKQQSLEDFGKQLKAFGQAMVDYGRTIANIDYKIIANSTTAGNALINMSKQLPQTDTFFKWMVGQNDLSKFGEQLVKFGKAMTSYGTEIRGLDTKLVFNSAKVGEALIQMANQLPATTSFFQWLTGNKNGIDTFGTSMVKFGQNLMKYQNEISNLSVAKMKTASDCIMSLIHMAKQIKDIDMASLSTFSTNMTNIAKNALKNFTEQFTGSSYTITNAVNSALGYARQAIITSNLADAFKETGQKIVKALIAGLSVTRDQGLNIRGTASTVAEHFANGVTSTDSLKKVKTSSTALVTEASKALFRPTGTRLADWAPYKAGVNYAEGFINGMGSKTSAVYAAATAMARRAVTGITTELQIKSPSRIADGLGGWFGTGFGNGMLRMLGYVGESSTTLATTSANALNDALDSALDIVDEQEFDPIIRPMIDLTDVEAGVAAMSNLLSNDAYSIATGHSSTIGVDEFDDDPDARAAANGGSVVFNQYNSSPKALSRLEIYRQTNNQLDFASGILGGK